MVVRGEPNAVRVPFAAGAGLDGGLRVCGVDFRSQDRAVADSSWHGRALDRLYSRPGPRHAMRRVPACQMAVAGVERVLAEHDVLARDILLVLAMAVVWTDYAGGGLRPFRPVDPAVFEGDLLRRVVS